MNRVLILALAIVTGAAAAARAQDQDVFFYGPGPLPAEPGQIGPSVAGGAVMFERPVEMMMAEPLDVGDPVTGAPYSADVTTEIVQVLADGNRIERRSTSSVARDSQGRVRRTQQLAAIGPLLPRGDVEIVTINDPVARVHYSLDTNRKVATQLPMMFTKKLEAPPVATAHVGSQPRDVRTETLGTRNIDGITAEGTRSVVTIAAGAIGNQAPIEIVSERWFSPELQTVVLSRRNDPRFGETTFRLENIDRSEPPAELFEIPSDFTVQAGRPPFGAGVRIERRIER